MAEDRIVLGDVSWQFGLSLFVLERFFLLGMGLGLCMKWAGAVKFFDPTLLILILKKKRKKKKKKKNRTLIQSISRRQKKNRALYVIAHGIFDK